MKFTGNWMEQLQKQNKTKNIQSEVPQTLKDKKWHVFDHMYISDVKPMINKLQSIETQRVV